MHRASTNNPKFNPASIARLEQVLISLKALYGNNLIEVSVFGSYSHGNTKPYSSIDLLIVIDESHQRFIKRIADVQRALNENDVIPQIDPLVYTEHELMDLIHKKESYIDSALREAVVIWNGSHEIILSDIRESNKLPSRYYHKTAKLEEIEF